MNGSLRVTVGRVLIIAAVSLIFLAYANFSATVFPSESVAGYVKNHFLREIIFGTAIAIWTIRLALQPMNSNSWLKLAIAGSIVVLPFWIAWTFGWFTGGMAEVWSGKVDASGAYTLHIQQIVGFYVGLVLVRGPSESTAS